MSAYCDISAGLSVLDKEGIFSQRLPQLRAGAREHPIVPIAHRHFDVIGLVAVETIREMVGDHLVAQLPLRDSGPLPRSSLIELRLSNARLGDLILVGLVIRSACRGNLGGPVRATLVLDGADKSVEGV